MRLSSIGRKVVLVAVLAVLGYLISYLYIRSTSIERWEKDGQDYVIFSKEPVAVYYFYRPLSMIDAALTGMRFHIGPHESWNPALKGLQPIPGDTR
jgi:hypothetical protein